MRSDRDADRAHVWRERLRRQAAGPWSIAEFCRREGVSQPAFYQWRKRLAVDPPGRAAANPRSARTDVEFVSVELPEAWFTSGVRIDLPGGAVVRLPQSASVEVIAAAIEAARRHATTREAQS